MPQILIPPQRSEATKGMLWWKKSNVVYRAKIQSADQAVACGISMCRALGSEFANRKRIESISAIFVCASEVASIAYKSYISQSEGDQKVAKWLLNDIPNFTLLFETPEGEIIRSFDYETVDGKRVVATSRAMNSDEEQDAKQRAIAGLQSMTQK